MSLILDHVSHIYNPGTTFEKKALDDVSLSFPDSQFVAVLGPSGSGKTTLLNVIGGLDRDVLPRCQVVRRREFPARRYRRQAPVLHRHRAR